MPPLHREKELTRWNLTGTIRRTLVKGDATTSTQRELEGEVKVVVLAGGRGTRLSEETSTKPKPMVEIGGRPMLWHILRLYSNFGVNESVICAGYRGDVIGEFFRGYTPLQSEALRGADGSQMRRSSQREPWTVSVIDTGRDTMTGGRVRRVRQIIDGERFYLTYGDGLSDVDIHALTRFHEGEGALVTLTAVAAPARSDTVRLSEAGNRVLDLGADAATERCWINGGFFVVEPSALDFIAGDDSIWEATLEHLAREGQLAAYRHEGFWRAMDTVHDKNCLEEVWAHGDAPWMKVAPGRSCVC